MLINGCTSSVAWSQCSDPGDPVPWRRRELQGGRKYVSGVRAPTPKVPAREAQFVRYSHHNWTEAGSIVDVSVGYAFGARRWISNLSSSSERFHLLHRNHTSPSDTPISPEGRRSLAITAKRMVISFVQTFATPHTTTGRHQTKPERRTWRSRPTKRGDPGKPPGLHELQVARSSSFLRTTESSTISEIYRTDLSGNVYRPNSIVHELATFSTGPDPRNCISVLAISRHRHPPSPGVFHR
ncbi:hypothetical protein M0R45_026137 [Rubus argutus]|uniref:HD-Zip IV C-terminal domain-containing protein n=1 Tax=Rubus argutus TaxID=59490 RepID=A0AAW1X016_RUBAR